MKYFYDTEFIENGKTIKLISIGIVAEDGRTYYAVNSDMPVDRINCNDWLMENVWPKLPLKIGANRTGINPGRLDKRSVVVKPEFVIRNEVSAFILPQLNSMPELWAYYGAYDHVLLAQLFGKMINLPKHIPMVTHDILTYSKITGVDRLPTQPAGNHNAMADALHVKTMYDHISREAASR